MSVRIYCPAKAAARPEGLIFDMDGVLFDTEKDSVPNIIETAAEQGFTVTREFVIENMGRNMAEESLIYAAALGPGFDPERFWRRYWQKRNEKYDREGMPVKEGALALLRAAEERGVPCAVASSSPAGEVRRALDRAGLLSRFACVVGGDMFRRSKPEPDIFLVGARELRAAPERCMVIEDSLNGMKAARAAGMIVAFVRDIPDYPESELKKVCDLAFDSAAEIAPLLG